MKAFKMSEPAADQSLDQTGKRETGKPASKAGRSGRPNKRSLARLGAVQALYQMDMTGNTLAEIIPEYIEHRLGQDVDDIPLSKADKSYFRDLMRGVVNEQSVLDPLIAEKLAKGWRLARINSILRAILRAAAFEMQSKTNIPARVIITEYIDIAHSFFDGDEPKVVNGILDRLARDLRALEFSNTGTPTGRG